MSDPTSGEPELASTDSLRASEDWPFNMPVARMPFADVLTDNFDDIFRKMLATAQQGLPLAVMESEKPLGVLIPFSDWERLTASRATRPGPGDTNQG